MTLAVNTTRHGNAFQARIFWRYAARLLDPSTGVQRVGFESGPRGFDDVWVEYANGRGPQDQFGNELRIERFQCKWHAAPGSYTHVDLTLPEYIGATSVSILQRARDAHRSDLALGQRSRIRLMTNHRINSDDVLHRLLLTQNDTLKLDGFLDGTTKRSAAWLLRDLWKRHLAMNDAELESFVPALAFSSVAGSLDDLRAQMDDVFRGFGITPSDPGVSSTIYDDLPYTWLGQGRNEFDADKFREVCTQAQLFCNAPAPRAVKVFGVKSFEHSFDRLEARCDDVLDLLPAFDARFLRTEYSWDDLLPKLTAFIHSAAKPEERLRLSMDAHLTLAFAAGTVLDTKSGRAVELLQRTRTGSVVWASDDSGVEPGWPSWSFSDESIESEGEDIAVGISITRPTGADVRKYLEGKREFGRLILADISGGSSQSAILNGGHADWLADKLSNHLKSFRVQSSPGMRRIHLFMSAPSSFAFFLGRHVKMLRPMTIYEYDFEGTRHGGYEPSLSISNL